MIKALKVSKDRSVTGRQILITEHDMKRLQTIIELYGWNDAPYPERLAEELDQAQVVKPKDIPSNIVTMNSVIRIRDLDTDEERTFALVFPGKTKTSENSVSITAPMGTALIGSREGGQIEWKTSEGMKKFQIVEILYQPERLGNYDL